ncbi:hypothetical protein DAI22_04g019650 [Oryza sativa Japonica Group]|nr:hypothetical protein DAI22_04g019650 [Oryza sativa Japonica Group]
MNLFPPSQKAAQVQHNRRSPGREAKRGPSSLTASCSPCERSGCAYLVPPPLLSRCLPPSPLLAAGSAPLSPRLASALHPPASSAGRRVSRVDQGRLFTA